MFKRSVYISQRDIVGICIFLYLYQHGNTGTLYVFIIYAVRVERFPYFRRFDRLINIVFMYIIIMWQNKKKKTTTTYIGHTRQSNRKITWNFVFRFRRFLLVGGYTSRISLHYFNNIIIFCYPQSIEWNKNKKCKCRVESIEFKTFYKIIIVYVDTVVAFETLSFKWNGRSIIIRKSTEIKIMIR